MIKDLRKARPNQLVEQDGLWYYLWAKKQQPGHTVEQLLVPGQYHQVVCKLAHFIAIAGNLDKDKIIG